VKRRVARPCHSSELQRSSEDEAAAGRVGPLPSGVRPTVERAEGTPRRGGNADRGMRLTQEHYNSEGVTDNGNESDEHNVIDEDS